MLKLLHEKQVYVYVFENIGQVEKATNKEEPKIYSTQGRSIIDLVYYIYIIVDYHLRIQLIKSKVRIQILQ